MKPHILKVRVGPDLNNRLRQGADVQGLTLSDHVRVLLERDAEMLSQAELIAKLDAKLTSVTPSTGPQNPATDLEPLLVEVLLLVRELACDRNAQILARVSAQVKQLYPNPN
jgi:hypothetical protein